MRTFQDAGMTGDFVHVPLEYPASGIRLVHIKPSDVNDDEIECTITTHDLSDRLPFAAISYTWGDMARMREITLNGKRTSIGENSWLVLWQARLHKIPLPVWIDVLSINQRDDVEKSYQVGSMSEIFGAAKFTCVGLGPRADDSELLAVEMRKHAYYIEHVRARSEDPSLGSTACSACGSPPTPRMYKCKHCVGSAAYCETCKSVQDAGHDLYLDVRTDHHHRSVCVRCERRLSTRWYQPKDDPEASLMKVCENCADMQRKGQNDDSWDREHVHMNEWEHMAKPQGLDELVHIDLKTFRRLFDQPLEDRLKVADAFRLLTIRPYFTRLWIVQEFLRSSSVIMVCGEDLFHYWELDAVREDIRPALKGPGKADEDQEYEEQNFELGIRGLPSYYFDAITTHDVKYSNKARDTISDALWDIVFKFSSHYCSDPRDRVFGLLAMAKFEHRGAFCPSYSINPDYTNSAITVLMQLIEHCAKGTEVPGFDGIEYNFSWAHTIIGSFGFESDNPEIAAMLNQRRTAVHGEDPSSDSPIPWLQLSDAAATTKDQKPPSIREDDPCSSDHPQQGLVPDLATCNRNILEYTSQFPDEVTKSPFRRVVLQASFHCTVWNNDAGQLVGHFCRSDKARDPSQVLRHDFSPGQGDAAGDGVRLHAPDGSVVGLANEQIQQGDTILLFEGDGGMNRGVFHSALIVRAHATSIGFVGTIVGQCILDSDVETYQGGPGFACGDDIGHVSDEETWYAIMSPEDLLVFVVQDLKLVHRQPAKFQAPMVDISVELEKCRDRLRTGVTSEELSSWATILPKWE